MSWTAIVIGAVCVTAVCGMYTALHNLLARLVNETAAARRELEALRAHVEAERFFSYEERKKRSLG